MAVIYTNRKKLKSQPGGYFHLEEEKSKTRVSGVGEGDTIRLKDEYGNVWLGSATRNSDNSVVYSFRDGRGKSMSGLAQGDTVTLRDDRGKTWKGFVD